MKHTNKYKGSSIKNFIHPIKGLTDFNGPKYSFSSFSIGVWFPILSEVSTCWFIDTTVHEERSDI